MTGRSPSGSRLAPLVTIAAGAVVTLAVLEVRARPVPEPGSADAAETEPAEAREASPVAEPPIAVPAPRRSGVPAVPPAPAPAAEARPPDTGTIAEEMQQLRDEVTRLKQELGQARADSQTAVLVDMDSHLAGIRTQLAENQAQHEQESALAREATVRRYQAVQMLFVANGRLKEGDPDVLDTLDAAAPALPYPAQTALANARTLIESENLYSARYWIGVAIAESGWSQITN